MRSEEISAPDWGLGRLTVTRDTYKMSGANFFDTTCPESKWETNSPESSNHTRVYMRSGFTRFKTYSEDNRWKISPTKCRSLTRQLSPHNSRYLWKLSTSLASINRSYAVILIITALCILCTGGVTGAVSNNKRPLIVTDATKNPDFRHFMQSNDDRPMARSSTLGEYRDPVDVLYFQTLKVITNWNGTRDILLVGGKNHVYMLDSTLIHNKPEIKYMERLTWIAPRGLRKECEMIPGQPAELCENFIRFVEVMESGELMVCGTNAFTPTCRYYTREHFNQVHDDKDSLFDRETKCRGQCVVPFNPTTASAALYTNTANGYQIFTAVQNEFMSDDPRIMRKDNPTLLSNALWLNDPTFIKIVEYEDKVYVFFREVAKQSESEYTQPITYARVAQMCKDDAGGGSVLANQWTSFLKARLVCGYSDRQHLQFNNLTSVSEITKVTGEDEAVVDVIFATFTTPWEWTDASLSAVCAFSMKEIKRGFEEGRFLQEYEIDAKPIAKADTTPDISSMRRHGSEDAVRKLTLSYPVPADDVPVPRPGSCLQTHKPEVLFFAKVHPLIYDPIEPYLNRPLFVSYNNLRATQISVDTNAGESGKLMIYLGTENGEVLRLRGMLSATEGPKAMLIESVMVGDEEICAKSGCGIRSLHVSRPPVGPSAFVAFTDYMVQFPLVRCFTYKTKGCCSIDPDCGWNGEECVHRTIENRENLLPTSKDADAIPESCNVIGENSKGENNKKTLVAEASSSTSVIFLLAFLGGCIVGALIVILIVFARRKTRRKRKHRVNRKSKSEKWDKEQEEEAASLHEKHGSNYMEMTKTPQQLSVQYQLPANPSSSSGVGKEKSDNVTKQSENNSSALTPMTSESRPPETFPLVEHTMSAKPSPTRNPITVETPSLSPTKGNLQNSNNSNNRCLASNAPYMMTTNPWERKPTVSLQHVRRNSSEEIPTTRVVGSSIKKNQSFAGHDRIVKPPVPKKSLRAQSFAAQRNPAPRRKLPHHQVYSPTPTGVIYT